MYGRLLHTQDVLIPAAFVQFAQAMGAPFFVCTYQGANRVQHNTFIFSRQGFQLNNKQKTIYTSIISSFIFVREAMKSPFFFFSCARFDGFPVYIMRRFSGAYVNCKIPSGILTPPSNQERCTASIPARLKTASRLATIRLRQPTCRLTQLVG